MADDRAERIAAFIAPLRVPPGIRLDLAKDFDPGYRSDTIRTKETGL